MNLIELIANYKVLAVYQKIYKDIIEDFETMWYNNIWKTVWFVDDEPENPMKGQIVAIDIHWRPIVEYEWLPNEVFCDTPLDRLVFEEPKKIIIVEWKRYQLID